MRCDRAAKRIRAFRAPSAMMIAAAFLSLSGSAAHAQSIMRSPSLNIGTRLPTINPGTAASAGVAARSVNVGTGRGIPANAGRAVTAVRAPPRLNPRLAVRATLPYVRYSPNLYPACGAADGECPGGQELRVQDTAGADRGHEC